MYTIERDHIHIHHTLSDNMQRALQNASSDIVELEHPWLVSYKLHQCPDAAKYSISWLTWDCEAVYYPIKKVGIYFTRTMRSYRSAPEPSRSTDVK